mgnify:CR=1 FL=1
MLPILPSFPGWPSPGGCDACQDPPASTDVPTPHTPSEPKSASEIKAVKAADRFFNLGSGSRFSSWDSLSSREKTMFIKMVAQLAQKGLIGYEVVDIDNRPYKSFATTQIGDSLTSNAPFYDRQAQYRWS